VGDPPEPGAATVAAVHVVASDEQDELVVEVDRWAALARGAVERLGRSGELTLTFVDETEIRALHAEHMGDASATDVLSFPLDTTDEPGDVPTLLGDVVVCPAVAAAQAAGHAGTLDDELALLVVHGVLHVLGHDHAEPVEAAQMRAVERELLEALHWRGPAPVAFRQELEA
jgi:probable rRNA maturation factor